ncbi:MAG: pentapeptide repeat-containing protein [Saprospiraceae bacterium]
MRKNLPTILGATVACITAYATGGASPSPIFSLINSVSGNLASDPVGAFFYGTLSKIRVPAPHPDDINHDLEMAFGRSVINAITNVETRYLDTYQFHVSASLYRIHKPKIKKFFKLWRKEISNQQPKNQVNYDIVKPYLFNDPKKAIAYLNNAYENIIEHKDDFFFNFIEKHLPIELKVCFDEELKVDTPAYRALTLLFQRETLEKISATGDKVDRMEGTLIEIRDLLKKVDFIDPNNLLLGNKISDTKRDINAIGKINELNKDLNILDSKLIEQEEELHNVSGKHKKAEIVNEINDNKIQLERISREISSTVNSINLPIWLAEEVKKCLSLSSCTEDKEYPILKVTDSFDFKVNIYKKETTIRCTNQEINSESVLKTLEEYQDGVSIIMISSRRVNTGLIEEFKHETNLQLFSLKSFVSYVFNLNYYFDSLQNNFINSNITEEYVDLNCIKPDYSSKGIHLQNASHESVEDYIDEWVKNSEQNHLTVLGDFGTGKTWLSWYYSIKQLKNYNKFSHEVRIPILITLRKYADCNSWEEIAERFIKNNNIRLTASNFNQLNKSGKLLIILDGFDELTFGGLKGSPKKHFSKLSPFVSYHSKVIMTSRKTYFRSEVDEADSIKVENSIKKSGQIDLRQHLRFGTIHLKEFTHTQIKKVLKNKTPGESDENWSKIKSRNFLIDLAKRPVMLNMILASLPEIDINRPINDHDLYNSYINKWINDTSKGRSFLDPTSKRVLINELAWKMYYDNKLEVHYSDLIQLIKNKNILNQLTPRLLELELRNQSFLIRDNSGVFYFAHKSFLEFIVASKLKTDIENNNYTPFKDQSILPEILHFLSLMDFNTKHLVDWVDIAREHRLKGFLTGNIFSLLKNRKYNFNNFNFSKLIIRDADFSGVDLTGSNFREADISSINFRDAILKNTDFTNAKLFDLKLGVRSPAKGVEGSDKLNLIATCNGKNQIVLIDGDLLQKRKHTLVGHEDSITSVYFNKDDKFLVSASFDNSVIIWKMDTKKPYIYRQISVSDTIIYDACVTPDNKYVITSDNHSRVKIWDIETEKEISSLEAHDSTVYNIDIHPDNTYIASASFDKTVILWHVDFNNEKPVLSYKRLKDHLGLVNGISFSPCGKYLASSSNDKSVILWDVEAGEKLYAYTVHDSIVWSVCFHPNGRYLASSSSDKSIAIWDLKEKEIVARLEGHESEIWNVSFFKSGKYLVSGGFDNTVRIWDWKNNKCIKLISLLEDVNQKIDCEGMRLEGVEGLSPLQIRFLKLKGAK